MTAVDHIECIIKLGEGDIERKIKNAFEPYELAKFHVTHYACLGVDVMKGGYDPTMYGKKLQDVYEKLSPWQDRVVHERNYFMQPYITRDYYLSAYLHHNGNRAPSFR